MRPFRAASKCRLVVPGGEAGKTRLSEVSSQKAMLGPGLPSGSTTSGALIGWVAADATW